MLMHLWQWIRNKKVSWGQVDFFVKTCHKSFIYIFTNGFFSIDLFNTVKGNIVSNECTCASAATTIVQPYLFCQFWFFVCINRMWWEKLFFVIGKKNCTFCYAIPTPYENYCTSNTFLTYSWENDTFRNNDNIILI